jgi:metal-responsive CopG/Arc/MetJ family transcriptional regulator
MSRTTISLPEDLLRRLKIVAAEEGTSMTFLVREAVEEKLQRYRPTPRSLGIAASAYSDTARRTAEVRPEPPAWR